MTDNFLTVDLVYKRLKDFAGNHALDYFYDNNRITNINKNLAGKYVLMFQNRRYTIVNKSELIKVVNTK